jgi:ketopantoate reductase
MASKDSQMNQLNLPTNGHLSCDTVWMGIPPGTVVYFDGRAGLTVVKLADTQIYDGVTEHCFVSLNDGHIRHVSELVILHAPYTGQFIWTD